MRAAISLLVSAVAVAFATDAGAQTLRGSSVAMERQHSVAKQHDFSFLETASQVRRFVTEGYLVKLSGNSNYALAGVSYPYARPAVKTFVERLASQYQAACGEKLVVTSLTRPVREQPRNASDLSVHPAGMAIDLRISRKPACNRWLEKTLLSLEKEGVLDVTRESRPPHYHVALFPKSYTKYLSQVLRKTSPSLVASGTPGRATSTAVTKAGTNTGISVKVPPAGVTAARSTTDAAPATGVQSYRVARGESLWTIARRFGTTVDALKSLNGFKSSALVAGQVISVPATANGAEQSD